MTDRSCSVDGVLQKGVTVALSLCRGLARGSEPKWQQVGCNLVGAGRGTGKVAEGSRRKTSGICLVSLRVWSPGVGEGCAFAPHTSPLLDPGGQARCPLTFLALTDMLVLTSAAFGVARSPECHL